MDLARCEIFSILNCPGAVRFFSFLFTYGAVKCGLDEGHLEYASFLNAFARKVLGPAYVSICFQISMWIGHAGRCLEAISEEIVRCSLNFLKIVGRYNRKAHSEGQSKPLTARCQASHQNVFKTLVMRITSKKLTL